MEPFDFDKFIKEKVQEEGNIHSRESNVAKSGIWIDVQDKLKKKHFISWYHLAASILLVVVGFSIILFRVQRYYSGENRELLTKLESVEKQYSDRNLSLKEKEEQINMLTASLENLENKFSDLYEKEMVPPIVRTVVKRDTVFVKTVEYVTYVPEEISTGDKMEEKPEQPPQFVNAEALQPSASGEIIYPSPKEKSHSEEPEKVRIRFGNYIAREN